MASNRAIATNDTARGWIFKSSVFVNDDPPELFNCLAIDGLSRDFGEPTRIECPDPDQYGNFIEIGTVGAETSRLSTSLSGRFSRTELSSLYKLASSNCAFDMQIHMGQCQRPDRRNEYDKVLVLENVTITNWSTDPLVAMTSGDRAVINESADISVGNYYEVVNLVYTIRGETQSVDGTLVSAEYYDIRNCGTCNRSDGCQKVFAVSTDGFGYYSVDGGVNWTRTLIADAAAAIVVGTVVDAMAYQGYYIALTAAGVFWYIDIVDWTEGVSLVWTQVASGLPGAGTSLTSYGDFGLVVGAGGVVSKFVNQDVGTTVVDDGTAALSVALVDVHTNGEVSVAVGLATVIYSLNGIKWQPAASIPVAAKTYSAVLVRSAKNWFVGTTDGELWNTDDGGVTWVQVAYPGWLSPTNGINDLQLSTNHILWMAQDARLLRSIDGGVSWVQEPNTRTNTFSVTALNSIASCTYDPNVIISVGTATDATGAFVVGSDPTAQ